MDGRDRIRPVAALVLAAIALVLAPAAAEAQSSWALSLGAKPATCSSCTYVQRLGVKQGATITLRTLVSGRGLPSGTRLVFRRRLVDPVTGATSTRPRLVCPAGVRACFSRRRSTTPAIFEYQVSLERGTKILAVSRIVRVTWTGGATAPPAPLPATGTLRFVEMTVEHPADWTVTGQNGRIAYTELRTAVPYKGVYWQMPDAIVAGSTGDVTVTLSGGAPGSNAASVTMQALLGPQVEGKAYGVDPAYGPRQPVPVAGDFATDAVTVSNSDPDASAGTIHRYTFTPTRAFRIGETVYIAIDTAGPRILLKYVAR